MKTIALAALLAAALLTSCGKGASRGGAADVCDMIPHAEALFGANTEALPSRGFEQMAGVCQWRAADGRRGGDAIVFTAQSLHGVTPAAYLADTAEKWAAVINAEVAPLEGVGDEAKIATHLPGYQTQIVFRKGGRVVTILAWSGDPALDGETLARRMAATLAAAP